MQGLIEPGHRDLDPGHKAQAQRLGLGSGLGQAEEFVVIGQGQQLHPVGVGAANHLSRRQGSVGSGGMTVQIGIQGVHDSFDPRKVSMIRATSPGWS